MQAKQLHEVLARVVAWHNRHPLALRISPQQVHSIGGVALPFASAQRPPDPPPSLDEVLTPAATDPLAAFAVAGADDHAPSGSDRLPPATEADADPAPTTPLPPLPELPPIEATADSPPEAPADPASETPPAAAEEPAASASDEAPIELAMALDEVAAQADAAAAAALAAEDGRDAAADTRTATAEDAAADAAPSDAEAPTEVLSATDATAPSHDAPAPTVADAADSPADATNDIADDAPLADRLRAARERAKAGGGGGLDLDIGHDGPTAGATVSAASAAHVAPVPTDAAPARQGWRARLAALRQRLSPRGAGRPAALSALFSQDFMWPRTPAQVADWARRHGSEQALAPSDWPQRQIETDAALLQAARRRGRPHVVTRHMLTAAIGVGDRRIRVLIDAEGHVFGPRAFDRRRMARLGSAGGVLTAVALVAVLGPWRQTAPRDEGHAAESAAAAASQAAAASATLAAASAPSAASAASTAHAAASDADADADGHGAQPAHAAASAPAADAHATAAAPSHDADHGPAPAHAAAPAPASALAAAHATAPAASSVVTVTHTPPPPYPVTRASGPIVAIRFRLSDEAKQAARDEVAAARAAARGEPPPPSPARPVRLAPTAPLETPVRVAQQPGTVYAVVTPPMPQRESAEAILAQMMSVRARLPQPAPDQGEVLQHQGRWRATWWPFASLAEAERARAMLVARGMRAEIIEF